MNKPTRVKITKLSGKPISSIPIGYWVDGTAYKLPRVGKQFWIEPVNRTSAHDRFDWFSTTEVVAFDGEVITTQNSKWKYEEIKQ